MDKYNVYEKGGIVKVLKILRGSKKTFNQIFSFRSTRMGKDGEIRVPNNIYPATSNLSKLRDYNELIGNSKELSKDMCYEGSGLLSGEKIGGVDKYFFAIFTCIFGRDGKGIIETPFYMNHKEHIFPDFTKEIYRVLTALVILYAIVAKWAPIAIGFENRIFRFGLNRNTTNAVKLLSEVDSFIVYDITSIGNILAVSKNGNEHPRGAQSKIASKIEDLLETAGYFDECFMYRDF